MKALVKFIEDSTFEVVSLSEIENFSFSLKSFEKAVAILLSTAICPQRLFCRELFVIGQS